MMTLEDEITEAQAFITDPPRNESNTCDWIILPLLWAAGYARRDIESRMADSTGQYPDYTILPNHPAATYYLEAKAWDIALEDKHVNQALNYANQNGKRFVVLTNGRSWRLYDNDIRGLLANKLLTQVELQNTSQITDFLSALSKPEVLQGSLERTAETVSQRRLQEAHYQQEQQRREEELRSLHQRQMEIKGHLDTILPSLLKDPNSKLIVLLAEHLREQEEMGDISSETLSGWFAGGLHQFLPVREEQNVVRDLPQMSQPFLSKQQGGKAVTLKELQGIPIDGKSSRPLALQTPDGAQFSTSSWVQLAAQVVGWLLQQPNRMPLPFQSGNRQRWFLNQSPEHKRRDQRTKFLPISVLDRVVYMDKDRSGDMFIQDLNALCLAMQVAPDTFRVTVLF